MAANASTSTGTTASFSVGWLKAIEFSDYITAFTIYGHVNYESCINLSEKVLRAVGVKNDNHVRLLMNRVKDLRKLSEEDAVKLLSSQNMSLYLACWEGDVKLAEQLIANGANVNWRNPLWAEATSVWIAAGHGNVDMLNMLIDAGGDVNIATVDKQTPVWIAAVNGRVEALNVLIRATADVNAADVNNATPVYVAAINGHVGALNVLIRAKADVNAANVKKATPAYVAAQNGHIEALSVLISAGADFNAANKNQDTPAHIAAYHGHVDILRLLHQHDAKLNTTNKWNKTPLDRAEKQNHLSVVDFFRAIGVPPSHHQPVVMKQEGGPSLESTGSPSQLINQSSLSLSQPSQLWRNEVTAELRSHLIKKLVEAVYCAPLQDPVALQDPRVAHLVQYAINVEKSMFENARSREAYYQLLAERIYRIRKELDERKGIKKEQATEGNPLSSDNPSLINGVPDPAMLSTHSNLTPQPTPLSVPNSEEQHIHVPHDSTISEDTTPDLSVDDDTAHEVLEQEVGVSTADLMLAGCPGSGKTSVMHLSLNEPPPDVRNSTGCVETPVQAIASGIIYANGTMMKKLETEEMLDMLCGALRHAIEEDIRSKHDEHMNTEILPVSSTATPTPTQASLEDLPRQDVAAPPKADDTAKQQVPTPPASATTEEEKLKVFANLMKEVSSKKASPNFLSATLVSTTDSGGQPQFMDACSLLLRSNSLFMITVKLNERLDEKPKFDFFINGKPISMCSTSLQLTNLQVIESIAKTMSSIQLSTANAGEDGSQPRQAKFMLVGTFADKADECEGETIADKNRILKDRLKHFEAELVDNGGDVIFPVNAVTTDPDERQKAALRLQEIITNTPGTSIKAKIKLRWFGLLMHMLDVAKKKEVSILQLDEIIAAGKCLMMSEEEHGKL